MSTNAQRKAAMAARDKVKGIRQLNLRVPARFDLALQLLARDLRRGTELQGFVVRDRATGRVKTIPA